MFAAVFLIFNYKIFTRYFEHNEAVWADEVLVILFIWIIFWAQAFVLRDSDQITFDLIYRLLPRAGVSALRHWRAMCWSAASFCGRCPDHSATSGFFGASTRRCSIGRSTWFIHASGCFSLPSSFARSSA